MRETERENHREVLQRRRTERKRERIEMELRKGVGGSGIREGAYIVGRTGAARRDEGGWAVARRGRIAGAARERILTFSAVGRASRRR